jgi:hypothetical protein
MDLDENILSPKYKDAAKTALWVQVPLGILSLLMLDGGQTAKVFAIALGAFWLCAILFAFRRPFSPKPADLYFWRWGFVPCFVLALFIAMYLGRLN